MGGVTKPSLLPHLPLWVLQVVPAPPSTASPFASHAHCLLSPFICPCLNYHAWNKCPKPSRTLLPHTINLFLRRLNMPRITVQYTKPKLRRLPAVLRYNGRFAFFFSGVHVITLHTKHGIRHRKTHPLLFRRAAMPLPSHQSLWLYGTFCHLSSSLERPPALVTWTRGISKPRFLLLQCI